MSPYYRAPQSAPELDFLRRLWRLGVRPPRQVQITSVHLPMRGKATGMTTADAAYRSLRIAIYFDGCYWHGCPVHYPACTEWRERTLRTTAALERDGWTVLRVWEHENLDDAAVRVAEVVCQQQAAVGVAA